MAQSFTKEQDEWLRKHHSPDKIIRDLTEEYNTFWNENRSVDTMKHHCKRIGLQQERRNFTKAEDEWLIARDGQYSVKELTTMFNETFGTNRSELVIKVHCNRNLRTKFAGNHFQPGDPIGTEVMRGKYVWVKVSNKIPQEGELSGWINWRPKAHVMWELHNGSMPPDGHNIVFLDGDRTNFDKRNLYAVNGKVLREMSKKKWWSSNPELTLAAIKWCELFYTIKEL